MILSVTVAQIDQCSSAVSWSGGNGRQRVLLARDRTTLQPSVIREDLLFLDRENACIEPGDKKEAAGAVVETNVMIDFHGTQELTCKLGLGSF